MSRNGFSTCEEAHAKRRTRDVSAWYQRCSTTSAWYQRCSSSTRGQIVVGPLVPEALDTESSELRYQGFRNWRGSGLGVQSGHLGSSTQSS
eukprot:555004-Rhodomonas_salina.1